MSKKQKKSSSKPKESKKADLSKPAAAPAVESSPLQAASVTTPPDSRPAGKAQRPLLRAIRVSERILEAAKAYKKATGISFYQLGLEAITERLEREGYLGAPAAPKS